jgi:hypothetical protein
MSCFHAAIFSYCAILAGNLAPAKPDAGRYGWLTSYPAALAEARRTGKPIFLVFRCEP